jgi:heme A synthase
MKLPPPLWIHRACLAFAALVFLSVLGGATITSTHLGPTVGFLPSDVKPHGHVPLGYLVFAGSLTLAVRLSKFKQFSGYGWAILLLSLASGVLGALSGKNLGGPFPAIAHALTAHTLFALSTTLALLTHPNFYAPATPFYDEGSPSLRSLAKYLPPIVFLQMILGALYRHNVLPLAPHLLGSCVAGAILFYVCTGVMTVASKYRAINLPASALLWLTILQMALGVAAYYGRVVNGGQTLKQFPAAVYTLAHTASGALILGATFVLSLQIFQHVQSGEVNTLAADHS